jgi:hypothetical protein
MSVPFVIQKLKNIKFSIFKMFSIYYFNIPTGSRLSNWDSYSFSMLKNTICV